MTRLLLLALLLLGGCSLPDADGLYPDDDDSALDDDDSSLDDDDSALETR